MGEKMKNILFISTLLLFSVITILAISSCISAIDERMVNNVKDEVPPVDDGSFTFQFSTTTLGETFTLNVVVEDWNDNRTTVLLPLRKLTENNVPSFEAKAGNREVELRWSPVPKTESYTLYYTTNGSLPSEIAGEKIENVNSGY